MKFIISKIALFVVILSLIIGTAAVIPSAYAPNWGTKTVYASIQQMNIGTNCDALYDTDTGVMTIVSTGANASVGSYSSDSEWPWHSIRSDIKKIIFADPVSADGGLTSMFDSMEQLTEIVGLNNFDTSNATNMASMFYKCISLESLDLSGLNTEKVKNISNMFRNCESLTELDLSSFDTSDVTAMQLTFDSCFELKRITFSSSFDTSNVTKMDSIFDKCRALENLDLSSFNTNKVTVMNNIFRDCTSLTSLDLTTFQTTGTTGMQEAFRGCSSLAELTLGSNFAFGTGSHPYPPSPSGTSITGFYTGKWINSGGNAFEPSDIPSNTADTYKAQILPVSLIISGSDLSAGARLDSVLENSLGKTFLYSWSKSDSQSGPFVSIAGATGSSYTISDGDSGKYLRCTATFENIVVSDTVGPVKSLNTPVTPDKPDTPGADVNNQQGNGSQTSDTFDIVAAACLAIAVLAVLIFLLIRRKSDKQ